MTKTPEKLLLDIRELSALIGISVGTLYHWVSESRVPCVRLSQRCLRFSVADIEHWLAELNGATSNRSPQIKMSKRGEVYDRKNG